MTDSATALADPPAKPKRKRRARARPVGRPSTFTPKIGRAICRKVAKGLPVSVAAQAIGISHSTVSNWIQRGASEPESQFGEFLTNLERSRAQGIESTLDKIKDAGDGGQIVGRSTTTKGDSVTVNERYSSPDWRAHQFRLQVADPDTFSPKQRVEHSGTIRQESVALNLNADLNADQMRALGNLLMTMGAHEKTPVLAGPGESKPAALLTHSAQSRPLPDAAQAAECSPAPR